MELTSAQKKHAGLAWRGLHGHVVHAPHVLDDVAPAGDSRSTRVTPEDVLYVEGLLDSSRRVATLCGGKKNGPQIG